MTSTYDLTIPQDARIRGIAGLAVRAGRALEAWGRRVSRPLDREQLEQHIAVQQEARRAIAERGDVHHGAHHLLR